MSERTKQVQFRMPEELHTELKAALVYDKSSFADFFNEAAKAYLNSSKEYIKTVEKINRGKNR